MTKISVILGSVRANRFGDKPARWILGHLGRRAEVQAELLDLLDYPMPFYAEPMPPAMKQAPFPNEAVERWTAKIAEADGFVFVTPEYNHGPSAVIKNALDYVYSEWNRKPAAFVSYGQVGGARAVEQLRLVAIELQMAPLRNALHIPGDVVRQAMGGAAVEDRLVALDTPAAALIDDLLWWTRVLKQARA